MAYKLVLDSNYTPYEGTIIGSYLINSDGTILEYARIQTDSGINTTLAASIVLNSTSSESLRDFIVAPDGTLHIYDGTFNPNLQSHNWQFPNSGMNIQSHSGWSTVNNGSYGGIDYYQDYVFVTDMKTANGEENGIIRFSQSNEPAVRFGQGKDFRDLTVGLDNLIYGLESYGKVSVYDPNTLQLVRSFTLQDKYNDYRGIAVNQQGEIFAAAWDGNVYYFDPQGSIVDVNNADMPSQSQYGIETQNLNDINISPGGNELIVSGRNGVVALLSIQNRSLELTDIFPTGGNSAFVSFGTSNNIANSNDSEPVISISDAEVLEWGEYEPSRLDFTVSLSAASDEMIEVDVYSYIPWGQEYDNNPNNFADSSDVEMKGEMLSFAPGETEKTFSIDVFDDWEQEFNEQVYVEIAHVFSNNAVIGDGLGIGTIIDDDYQPAISISDFEMVEGDYEDYPQAPPIMEFTLSLDAPAYHPIMVDLNLVDYPTAVISQPASMYQDYFPLNDWMNLTFEPGETSKTVAIEIHPDDEYEPTEQIGLEIVNAYGAVISDGLGIGTIIDDDFVPFVSISDAEVLEGDGYESTWMNFTVSLSDAFDEPVEVDVHSYVPWGEDNNSQNYADLDDFVSTGEMLTFAPGETELTFAVEIKSDLELEADEQILAEVGYVFSDNAEIGNGVGIGTILDNEARKPQVSISDAVAIEGTTLEFAIALDRPSDNYVTVDAMVNPYFAGEYKDAIAVEGEDYWGNWQNITFAPGETSKTFTVDSTFDLEIEGNEQFAVEIYSPSENVIVKDPIGMGTIIDNDLVIGEVGHVEDITHLERTIKFQNEYVNPVVFVSPLTRNGGDPAVARITSIEGDRFSVFVQEPTLIKQKNHSGAHTKEDFSYLVMEAGSWTMPDGSTLEVGLTDIDTKTRSANWDSIEFVNNFVAPTVISTVQTNNNEELLRLRQRNGSQNGFELALEKEEALLNTNYQSETVGYLALESGENHLFGNDINYLASETGRIVNHRWHQLDTNNYTYLFASTNSYYGGDSVGLRHQMGSIMMEEDTSKDLERGHTRENVAYLGFDNLGAITTEVWDLDLI